MKRGTLGKTGCCVNKTGFGALPIQRVPMNQAVLLLQKAYNNGVDFYDTARAYTDSEEKLGNALGGVRNNIVIATKTAAVNTDTFWKELETSLKLLKTDYIDIYQFHNPKVYPKPEDGSGLYEAMLEARRQGMVRHIGITNHRPDTARGAVESGLYETLQFPFSYLSGDSELELVALCAEKNVGFIAMKALSGGLITNAEAACAFMEQFGSVLPIWGIQRESELDEFIACSKKELLMTEEIKKQIERDKSELFGDFCRGCGYCMPCPAGIQIHMCARMSLMARRAHVSMYLTDSAREMMARIEDCTRCGRCAEKCPYGLDTPALLQKNYADYIENVLKNAL